MSRTIDVCTVRHLPAPTESVFDACMAALAQRRTDGEAGCPDNYLIMDRPYCLAFEWHAADAPRADLVTVALIDAEKVGLGLLAYVNIRLNKHSGSSHAPMSDFARDVQLWPEVVECYAMSGDMDYLLRIQVADLAHFSKFAMDTLMRHPAVVDMRSFFALQQIKETTELRL